ncbi:RpiR family transcriptional regulator [Terasakiella brassicae]|uniref:RpiR family transcriptional regulator n=1 Tax=Terasakiella brassicae TaxID=1634917 RepID=A0A917BR39_9PROT|nr:MurR/RpiR family transcriptional regulator [Terasakiella brassicae]GGF55869.1 RpiR family transcriptional regulator [Terasakiella brassicae]
MTYDELLKRINESYQNMSPQVQLAARYVIDNAEDVALVSMRQLAKEANVHPTTMVRLGQFLGFEGFNDMRDLFQHRLRLSPEDYVGRARGLQRQAGHAFELIEEIEETSKKNIHRTLHAIGADILDETADFLLSAKRIYVMGMRISFPVAFAFYYAYSMFRANAHLIDGKAGIAADTLRDIGPGDVLFAISNTPFSRETVQAAQYARKKGATIVAISDTEISPIVGPGDRNLMIRNVSPTFFPSASASIALVESLIAIMISKGGEELVETVAQSKEQLDQFDAYWEDQP